MTDFEWNESKRKLNLSKHGIDFVDGIKIFNDYDRIELETSRSREKRYQTIGIVEYVEIFLVYTMRGKKKRIISARRASRYERKIYYEAKTFGQR